MRRFWQMCASPSRHWWQCPQLTCISALTKSPALTARTSSPTRSTVPQNSCPSVTGGLMRPCDQRSHPYMCKSVPQIEAVFTRTSTSVGPIKGTATISICKPFAACIFRNAFIVAAILRSCLSSPVVAGLQCKVPRHALHRVPRHPLHFCPLGFCLCGVRGGSPEGDRSGLRKSGSRDDQRPRGLPVRVDLADVHVPIADQQLSVEALHAYVVAR